MSEDRHNSREIAECVVDSAFDSFERLRSVKKFQEAQRIDFCLNAVEAIVKHVMTNGQGARSMVSLLKEHGIEPRECEAIEQDIERLAQDSKAVLRRFISIIRSPWALLICYLGAVSPFTLQEELYQRMVGFLESKDQPWIDQWKLNVPPVES